MILAVTIGNTHVNICLKEASQTSYHLYTSGSFSSKEDFIHIIAESVNGQKVEGIVISSVDPNLTPHLQRCLNEMFSVKPVLVGSSLNMKLDLSLYEDTQIGNDRIAICEAALHKYKTPIILFDFGTAITINVIDEYGKFIGGSIMPGLTMGLHALSRDTAQLPNINFDSETKLMGQNTRECILSGVSFGTASMLDGMVLRIEAELGQKTTVAATGGNAKHIIPLCNTKIFHEPELLMTGLYILYERNR